MQRAGGGFDRGYNAQTAVDDAAHIIVAAELTNSASDAAQLPRMLRAVEDNLGQQPQQALADTGYRGEQVFERWPVAARSCSSRSGAKANSSCTSTVPTSLTPP
jgi:hypothetical protein